jgi:hypothetical protein
MTLAAHRANVRRTMRAARKVNKFLLNQCKKVDQKFKTFVARKTDIELGEMGAITLSRNLMAKQLASLDNAIADVFTIMGTW